MQINAVDIFALAIVVASAVRGLVRGLSREIADLFRILGAFMVAYFFYVPCAAFLFEKSRLSEIAATVVAFLTVLLLAFLVLSMLHVFLSRFMQFAFKGPLERFGGLFSGMIKGTITAFVLVLLISFWPHDAVRSAVCEQSIFGGWVAAQYPRIYEQLSDRYPLIQEMEHNFNASVPSIMKSSDSEGASDEWEDDDVGRELNHEY